jgi:hypothetical protein
MNFGSNKFHNTQTSSMIMTTFKTRGFWNACERGEEFEERECEENA